MLEAKYPFIRDDVILKIRVSDWGTQFIYLQKIDKKSQKIEFEVELDCVYTCIVNFPYDEWLDKIENLLDWQKNQYSHKYNMHVYYDPSVPSDLTNEEKFFVMCSWAEVLSESGINGIRMQRELEEHLSVEIPLVYEFLRFFMRVDSNFINEYLDVVDKECQIDGEPHLNSLFSNIYQILNYLIFDFDQIEYEEDEDLIRKSYKFVGNGLFIMKNSRNYIDHILDKFYLLLEHLFSEKMKNTIERLPNFNIENPDIIEEIKTQSKISGKIQKKKLIKNLEFVIGVWLVKDEFLSDYLSDDYSYEYDLAILKDKKDLLCNLLMEFISYVPSIIGHKHIIQLAFFLTDALPDKFEKIYSALGAYIESEELNWDFDEENRSMYDRLNDIVMSKIGREEPQESFEPPLELSHILKYLFYNNAKIDSIPLTHFRDVSERYFTILLFDFIRKNRYSPPVTLWVKAKKIVGGKKYSKAFLTSDTLSTKTNELASLLSKRAILHEDEEYLNDDYMDLSMEYDAVRRKFLDNHKDISYNAVPREIELYFWIYTFDVYEYNVLEYLFLTLSYTNLWFEKDDVVKALKMLDFDRLLAEWEYLCTIMDTKYLVFREYYTYFPFDEFL